MKNEEKRYYFVFPLLSSKKEEDKEREGLKTGVLSPFFYKADIFNKQITTLNRPIRYLKYYSGSIGQCIFLITTATCPILITMEPFPK